MSDITSLNPAETVIPHDGNICCIFIIISGKIPIVLLYLLLYNQFLLENPMTAKMFSGEQKAKLTQLVNEGMRTMMEIEDLSAGLSDTIKAVAEELEVKPGVLKKAIRIAHKASLGETNRDHEDLNTILETVGKTL